ALINMITPKNLTNQRAFHRGKEDYVRIFETKANTYEILYTEAQAIEETQQMCDSNSFRSIERQSDDEIPVKVEISDVTYGGNRNIRSFTFNEYHSQTNSVKSDESVEDIIRDPLFCDGGSFDSLVDINLTTSRKTVVDYPK
ncbi:18628_t:CDS:2, partial [Funneliformis geosporum]